MKKCVKKFFSALLAFVLLVSAVEIRADADAGQEVLTIRPDQREGSMNYFAYTAYVGKSWASGSGEAYIDLGSQDARAEECYYEVPFAGNTVEVFAVRAANHGKVQYSVDGQYVQIVDLYNNERTQAQSVYKVSGLAEGEHILKAVTQKEKTGTAIVNQVSYVNVIHAPYTATDVQIEQKELQMKEGQSAKIAAVLVPVYAPVSDLHFGVRRKA